MRPHIFLVALLTGMAFLGFDSAWGKQDIPVAEWLSFQAEYGSNFHVRWDEELGTPRMIFGGSVYLESGAAASKEAVERATRKFIEKNQGLLKADVSDLKLKHAIHLIGGTPSTPGHWYVTYNQYHRGVLVWGGKVGLTVNDKDEVVFIASGFHSSIEVTTTPSLSESEALDLATRKLGLIGSVDKKDSRLTILPVGKDGGLEYHLTWRLVFLSVDTWVEHILFVDAVSGEIWRHYKGGAFLTGGVDGYVWPEDGDDTKVTRAFK